LKKNKLENLHTSKKNQKKRTYFKKELEKKRGAFKKKKRTTLIGLQGFKKKKNPKRVRQDFKKERLKRSPTTFKKTSPGGPRTKRTVKKSYLSVPPFQTCPTHLTC